MQLRGCFPTPRGGTLRLAEVTDQAVTARYNIHKQPCEDRTVATDRFSQFYFTLSGESPELLQQQLHKQHRN